MIGNLPGLSARLFAAMALCAVLFGAGASLAAAAEAPLIASTWVEKVTATSADPHAEINPNGSSTTYRFEYISEAAYQANLSAVPAREGFSGAAKAPPGGAASIGSGSANVTVSQHLGALSPVTVYRFRVVATNFVDTTIGPERFLGTEAATNVFRLLDNRGWEMVSPIDKNGGAIQGFGANFGGDVLQAAADGNSATYSSADSFGAGPQGAPAASQYLARRGGGGWVTENITTPLLSGSYSDNPVGVPYQLFSADLSHGLLSNGERCRGSSGECPVANPPLPGTGAPAGYRDYYLRDDGTGSFASLLQGTDVTKTALGPAQFELDFVAASPDLSHVVLSSCAALTSNATEVPAVGGCDPAAQNLYEWSGSGLSLVNLTPGAKVAAQAGAVSADGARIYWVAEGSLHLREGAQTKPLGESAGGTFQTASDDGRFAFFTAASGDLYRYDAVSGVSGVSTDLTPTAPILGVLGASADGSHVYYASAAGLFLWDNGTVTKVAAAAAASDYPPATGTARVSPDGSHLAFVSAAELTGYDNNGGDRGLRLRPTAGRRRGAAQLRLPATRPANGLAAPPRSPALSPTAKEKPPPAPTSPAPCPQTAPASSSTPATGWRSRTPTNVPTSMSGRRPAPAAAGSEVGCVDLISSGRSGEASTFVDASADGIRRLLPHRQLTVPPRPRLVRPLRRPRRRRLPAAAERDPLRRRRLPEPAGSSRRPDPRHPGAQLRQPAAAHRHAARRSSTTRSITIARSTISIGGGK